MDIRPVIERAGSRIHAGIDGPDAGPLVALTHGASMDHRMFEPQLEPLTTAGYRVLTWDLRGHGRSKPIGRTPLTISALADDLLALLDQVEAPQPVCLVGQSLGAYVAQDIVYRHPDRVACLVVIGGTCMTLPIARWEAMALRSSPLWFKLWPDGDLRRRIATATALRPEVRDYALEATRQLTKQEFVEVWKAVARAIRPGPDYRIEHPLLLTHGDQDTTGNIARTAPRWAAREPRCRYEVIPDASHNANQDNPAAFNHLLLEFLNTSYPAQGR